MVNNNILKEKSFEFAVRIVNVYKFLIDEKNEKVLSLQLLKSGTSIGANISEGTYAASRADFISKLHIALKEASETEFWLNLLVETGYLTNNQSSSLIEDCKQLLKLLISILNKLKKQNG